MYKMGVREPATGKGKGIISYKTKSKATQAMVDKGGHDKNPCYALGMHCQCNVVSLGFCTCCMQHDLHVPPPEKTTMLFKTWEEETLLRNIFCILSNHSTRWKVYLPSIRKTAKEAEGGGGGVSYTLDAHL